MKTPSLLFTLALLAACSAPNGPVNSTTPDTAAASTPPAVASTAGAAMASMPEASPATSTSVAPNAVPPYDPKATFADKVEQVQGPFGLRIETMRLGSEPDVGLEVVVDGFAGPIPNVVGDGERVRLFVDSVRSATGQELLRPEPCGKDRNTRPAPFGGSIGERLKAEKTVRLVRDVDSHDIASV